MYFFAEVRNAESLGESHEVSRRQEHLEGIIFMFDVVSNSIEIVDYERDFLGSFNW